MRNEIKARLIKHLTFLETELEDHSLVAGLSWEEYNKDRVKRRNAERWAENVVNSSVDIAKIVLFAENLAVPGTYREIIVSLSLVPGFDRDTCDKMGSHVRLRNIHGHEYLDIRWESLKRFIDDALPLYRRLLADTKSYLNPIP